MLTAFRVKKLRITDNALYRRINQARVVSKAIK